MIFSSYLLHELEPFNKIIDLIDKNIVVLNNHNFSVFTLFDQNQELQVTLVEHVMGDILGVFSYTCYNGHSSIGCKGLLHSLVG